MIDNNLDFSIKGDRKQKNYILAFDSANETIAIGIGQLERKNRTIIPIVSSETPSFRSSNTKLLSCITEALAKVHITKEMLSCLACGRGPGSFTGVRIALATAKGIVQGLNCPLYGLSSLDAQAWQFWYNQIYGEVIVLGDAMRHEVYPVRYQIDDRGIKRCNADCVIKASDVEKWIDNKNAYVTGDALYKYPEIAKTFKTNKEINLYPTGLGLLLEAQDMWKNSLLDPNQIVSFDKGDPKTLLPVYTRLSDAEEHERSAFAAKNNSVNVNSVTKIKPNDKENNITSFTIRYQPLDASWIDEVVQLDLVTMPKDSWSKNQFLDDLKREDRRWWAAFYTPNNVAKLASHSTDQLVGFGGAWIVDGVMQILKIATHPDFQRLGIAQTILRHLGADGRDLGANSTTLEVRATNFAAQKLYEKIGLQEIGLRPHYYQNCEDAKIYSGPIPSENCDNNIAGMDLVISHSDAKKPEIVHPLILGFESSCDETAASLIDGEGKVICDVIASQIDFHSRFGGVVPEIASRKHIEAISGISEELLAQVRTKYHKDTFSFNEIDAICATYTPGLVGALVVGLGFAKGLAWALNKSFIGINHLEGHIYANRLICSYIKMPMICSIVSGGHTQLVLVKNWGNYKTLGTTLDDAVGEAFDKVAKALGLSYPGGPIISKLASSGNPKAISFPRSLINSNDYDFSLSGLKTSVLTYLQQQEKENKSVNIYDVCASFEAAVIDVQIKKAKNALLYYGAKTLCVGGGVGANIHLRQAYENMCHELGIKLILPNINVCTDNASMIARVGLDKFNNQKFSQLDLDVYAHSSLDDI